MPAPRTLPPGGGEVPAALSLPAGARCPWRGKGGQPDRTELPAWAHPVVANGKLHLRDQDTLYGYDVQARKP